MHLDPKKFQKWSRDLGMSRGRLAEVTNLPRDLNAGFIQGELRADGLLATKLEGIASSPSLLPAGGSTAAPRAGFWCEGSCPACEAPLLVTDEVFQECYEMLGAWTQAACPAEWIDNAWFTSRSLRSEFVTHSGIIQWLRATAVREEDSEEGLWALSRLLVGPPTTRVRMVFFDLPARDELRARVRLPDGWLGGALPAGLLGQLYPLPAALSHAEYPRFDPFEARLVWVAWLAEPDLPPSFPDPIYRGRRPQVDVAEGIIALLHSVVHPGRIVPMARVVAFQHQGLSVTEGRVAPGYEESEPEEEFNPLVDEIEFDWAAMALEHDPWFYEESMLEFDLDPEKHARAFQGLAAHVSEIDTDRVEVRRAARAATHLARNLSTAEGNPAATALDYAIALELLLNDGGRREAISRSLAQAAANLAGANDEERADLVRVVADLYRASSDYRHGSEPELSGVWGKLYKGEREVLDLDEARAVVRRVAASVLNLVAEGRASPAKLADRATFDRACADDMEAAVHRLHGLLGSSIQSLDAAAAHPVTTFEQLGTFVFRVDEDLDDGHANVEPIGKGAPGSVSAEEGSHAGDPES